MKFIFQMQKNTVSFIRWVEFWYYSTHIRSIRVLQTKVSRSVWDQEVFVHFLVLTNGYLLIFVVVEKFKILIWAGYVKHWTKTPNIQLQMDLAKQFWGGGY